jgi:membrane protein YqaA with SNARE-associated domain
MIHYTPVFIEAMLAANIIPAIYNLLIFVINLPLKDALHAWYLPNAETIFYSMQAFGTVDMRLPVVAAITGAMAGQFFNWLIGYSIYRLKSGNMLKINNEHYARGAMLFQKYGVFLLLFSWVPLCNLLVVVAGMANFRLRMVLPLILVGQIYNYGRYLF